jgi:hypothetical protein
VRCSNGSCSAWADAWYRYPNSCSAHWSGATPTNSAVREIPRRHEAISPEVFADELGLSLEEVGRILDELERRMTFLCRRGGDDVNWAYPVTATDTVHQVRIDGGAAFSAA